MNSPIHVPLDKAVLLNLEAAVVTKIRPGSYINQAWQLHNSP